MFALLLFVQIAASVPPMSAEAQSGCALLKGAAIQSHKTVGIEQEDQKAASSAIQLASAESIGAQDAALQADNRLLSELQRRQLSDAARMRAWATQAALVEVSIKYLCSAAP